MTPKTFLLSTLMISILLAGCNDNDNSNVGGDTTGEVVNLPAAPKALGFVDTAPVAVALPAVVDQWFTNQRGDARYATIETNAGVRVLSGFMEIWKPSTSIVDASVTAEAQGGFPAITPSTWTGIPNDKTDGTKLNIEALTHNIDYSKQITQNRTPEEAIRAYLDDRRGKSYSVTTAMGALSDPWRSLTGQTTTINNVPNDAAQVKYNDEGSNTGLTTAQGNQQFGEVVGFIQAMGNNSSTEPAKRFYKYARPWRWSNEVIIVPSLESAKSTTPENDGGFPSGHTAEAGRNAIAMAYLVPQRYQELVARGMDLGDSRIIAGMHSAFDVIGGRIQSIAADVANLNAMTVDQRKLAYQQAQTELMKATKTNSFEDFYTLAKQPYDANDRFLDLNLLKQQVNVWMTYGFKQIAATDRVANVPKGAEVLLETRFPYLTADQRRVVLKTTAIASGYPVMDDAEGYGRLNLFNAGGGYGAFNGDVIINMNADQGGFEKNDTWSNDIIGEGKLLKQGTGHLALSGNNSFTGGLELKDGVIEALSANAFGRGDVYVSKGLLKTNSQQAIAISGKLTLLSDSNLEVNLNSNLKSYLNVGDLLTVQGTLALLSKEQLKSGSYEILTAKKIQGKFSKVTLNGKDVTVEYRSNSIILKI